MNHAEELTFARAMLANPSESMLRLVYADWLCDEVGDVERAALVREAEGWTVTLKRTDYSHRVEFRAERQWRCTVRVHLSTFDGEPPIECTFSNPFTLFSIRPDGSGPYGSCNWAWLLSLVRDRGLEIPGLDAPGADPELET